MKGSINMTPVIRFPPDVACPICQIKLRPATANEIKAGLENPNPTIRQSFAHAVQGQMDKKFVAEDKMTSMLESETLEGTWVMLCDSCGHISVCTSEENL